jgi:glucans biosynthesis protein
MTAFQKELGLAIAMLVGSAVAAAADDAAPFGHDWLVAHARSLSEHAYVDPAIAPGNALAQLSYNQYRAIRFKRDAAIWRGESRNFSIELLHLGFMFTKPVAIHLVG